MHFTVFTLLALLLLAFYSAAIVTNDNPAFSADTLRERAIASPDRELKAATKAIHLTKRHTSFFTSRQIQLTYTERENLDNAPNFGATLHCNASKPILLLEDFEHLTNAIVCEPGKITISLRYGADLDTTTESLLHLANGGLVITSHYGCNMHGERRLFKVGSISRDLNGDLVLETMQASWETAFHSLEVKMYRTTEGHVFRPHSKIRRQQVPIPALIDNKPPFITPSATSALTSNKNSSTIDLNKRWINQPLFDLENSTLQFSCKNCSTYGTLDLSFLEFKFKPNFKKITTPPVELGDVFEGGELEIVANKMGARIELLTNITGSAKMDVPLFQIPLVFGLAIKGIGAVGVLYGPRVHVDYRINGPISFTYGFEINVPDKSRLFLDMTELGKSSLSGFQNASIKAIPFQASVDVNAAVIDISLRHQIGIGFWFLGENIGAEVGVYLDLPKYRANFAKVQGVDENCTSLATSQSKDKDIAQRVLTDAYSIQPSVNWQVGLAGQAKYLLFKDDFDVPFGNGTISTAAAQCLQFNITTGKYIDAKEVVAEAKKNSAVGIISFNGATSFVTIVSLGVAFLI